MGWVHYATTPMKLEDFRIHVAEANRLMVEDLREQLAEDGVELPADYCQLRIEQDPQGYKGLGLVSDDHDEICWLYLDCKDEWVIGCEKHMPEMFPGEVISEHRIHFEEVYENFKKFGVQSEVDAWDEMMADAAEEAA